MSQAPQDPMHQEASTAGRIRRRLWRLASDIRAQNVAVGTVIGLLTWPVADAVTSGEIDISWIVGLHLAAQRGMSFGSGIDFTFGPLGFLGSPEPYMGWTSALSLAFVGFVHIALCSTMFHLARQAIGGTKAFVLVLGTAFAFPW